MELGLSDLLEALEELIVYVLSLWLYIWKGLSLAWHRGVRHLKCYSDSQLALRLIHNPPGSLHAYDVLIENIRGLLSLDWELSLTHTLRAGNL